MPEEKRQNITIIDKNVNPKSKRAIRVTLNDGRNEKEKFIYPINDTESVDFYESLRAVDHPFLPRIEMFFNGAGKKFAMSEATDGIVISECRGNIKPKHVENICRDIADCVAEVHGTGYSFNGFLSDDILLNDNGVILPPPAYRATEANIQKDLSSVGGLFYELLTGITYNPGTEIYAASINAKIPERLKSVIINSTSNDRRKNYRTADDLLDAMSQKKQKPKNNKILIYLLCIVLIMGAASVAAVLIYGAFNGGSSASDDKDYNKLIEDAAASISGEDYVAAGQYVDKALQIDSVKLPAYYYEALILYKQADYEAMIDYSEQNILNKSFEIAPEDTEITKNLYYIIGCSYYQTGDYENAYSNLETAKNKGYESEGLYTILAVSAVNNDNIPALNDLMSSDYMGDGGTAYMEALQLQQSESYNAAAIKYYEASGYFTQKEISEQCVLNTINCYMLAEDYTSTINACNTALTSGISKKLAIKLWEYKAMAQYDQAKADDNGYEEAVQSYESLIALSGNDADAEYYYYAGACYIELELADKAEDYLKYAVENGDDDLSAAASQLLEDNGFDSGTTDSSETSDSSEAN